MKFPALAAFIALQLATTPLAAAQLSSAEQRMTSIVDKEQPQALALLEKLVNQNSGTLNLAGVEKVGQMVRAELEPLGFRVTWKPQAEAGRAGHLIAVHQGKKDRKKLLLIGHLDTVFEPSSPFQKFEIQGDRAAGPGVGDDKGGIVVMLSALRAMKEAGTLKDANIEIHLTGDEEDAGNPTSISRADLVAAGKRSDIALDFEGLVQENGADMGSIARRSSESWLLTTSGQSGHSSSIFSEAMGDGAIFEMTRILHRFRTELPETNLTFNVGLILGGEQVAEDAGGVAGRAEGKSNVIAGTASARGDTRTLSPEQSARVRAKMAAIVAENSPLTAAKLEFDPVTYPSMAPTAGNRALLQKLNHINKDLGLAEMAELDPLKRGAGDISFVASDVDGLAGLGPYSVGDHSPAEAVILSSIPRQAKRAAILMSRLAAEKR
jgi:glutamate carboxypeptidase